MFKQVFIAPDEFTAITIREMLKGVNIDAEIRRFETAWLDGLFQNIRGGWGEILVEESNLAEARECIQEFLESPTTEDDIQEKD